MDEKIIIEGITNASMVGKKRAAKFSLVAAWYYSPLIPVHRYRNVDAAEINIDHAQRLLRGLRQRQQGK